MVSGDSWQVPPEHQMSVAMTQLRGLTLDVAEVKDSIRKLADAFTKLAIVEERQASDRVALGRAFSELERQDARLKALEQVQPLHKQSHDWVQRAAGLMVAAMLGAVVTGVIKTPEKAPQAQIGHP